MSDSATLWTVVRQAPPSMGFSRQEYWSGLSLPSPGVLPHSGMEHASPALAPGKQNNLRVMRVGFRRLAWPPQLYLLMEAHTLPFSTHTAWDPPGSAPSASCSHLSSSCPGLPHYGARLYRRYRWGSGGPRSRGAGGLSAAGWG